LFCSSVLSSSCYPSYFCFFLTSLKSFLSFSFQISFHFFVYNVFIMRLLCQSCICLFFFVCCFYF
jgi:hypothetical protein